MIDEHSVPSVIMSQGIAIPQLGLGVSKISRHRTGAVVSQAIDAGYRHIDNAPAYGNEAEVGRAVRRSGIDRGEFFITTKCPNEEHGRAEARSALEKSLDRLGLDYVDLYLIHWPLPSQDRYAETWRALVDARDAGLVRSVGVSNFEPEHIDRIVKQCGVAPAVNQIELHPYLSQTVLRRRHAERGIVTEAWCPLAHGAVLADPMIRRIADDYERTPAQVVLRWHIQSGTVVFPKATSTAHLMDNIAIFDFELSEDDIDRIDGLDRDGRIGPHPARFG